MFAFWLFFWFYCPISAAQAIAYLLVLAGIFKHEPRFLLYSKCLLALTLVANLLLGIMCFFFYAFVFGIYFFMFGFIFFIGIGFTGFAVFIIHRAHKTMEGTGCDHPPPVPGHQYPPAPSYGNVREDEIEKVDLMFEEIKSKINGKLGYACICLFNNYYGNETRKKFIELGLKSGFKNVEIINWETTFYLNAMLQINYKPVNGNVIWIQYYDEFFIWEINNQKSKFLGMWEADPSKLNELQKIVDESKLNKGPNVVLYNTKIDESNLRKISACLFFRYEYIFLYTKGCLLKARITAGDCEFAHLNVLNYLDNGLTLKYGNEEILSVKFTDELPIRYFQKFIKDSSYNTIDIGKAERKGTEIDEQNIRQRFSQLGYKVCTKENLTAADMLKTAKSFAKDDKHKFYDSCVVFVLTHGKYDHFLGVDNKEVNVHKFLECFNAKNAPLLKGKPKLFFIQACRGRECDNGTNYPDSHNIELSERFITETLYPSLTPTVIPIEGDMIIAYSTPPNYVSWKNEKRGSWFIESVCNIIGKYAKTEEICSISTKVNQRVAKAEIYPEDRNDFVKQIPRFESSLTKKFYFVFRGTDMDDKNLSLSSDTHCPENPNSVRDDLMNTID
uniref:Caspase family p20 domain-containing protein n=1 Tax=Panagrolaimus davidi TaxID=227884 RepID=A0A914QKL0_9BILA